MAEVRWIKIAANMFDNRKIKQIECLPDGYAIIVIWMKLLCLAGNINDSGMVYFTKDIPYTEQMLVTQFGMPLATIQLALKTFETFEMIEVIDDILHISNWEKYQSVDRLNEIREYNRLAKRKSRERQKLLNVNDMSMTCQSCHDTDIDIDKEEDIDKDNNKVTCKQVVELFHSICISYPKVKSLSDSRIKAIKARMKKYSLEDFEALFKNAEASDFLKGSNDRNWAANFDWLIKDANMAKVIDGNYSNRQKKSKSGIMQQHYDFDKLMEGL